MDAIMVEHRCARIQARSIKKASKAAALKLAISMVDLTTLEGADTPEKVRSLCRKGVRPFERDEEMFGERLPHVGAICVYPAMVPAAREELDRLGATGKVKVASVATGFPSGQYPLHVRIEDTQRAVEAGADEIDMVINRGAFLSGRYEEVAHEIREVCAACGPAHLKVILETGELSTYDNVRRASDIALANIREHDFIKTSTGKVSPAATMPVTLVMLEAIRDNFLAGHGVHGMKPAGGIRTAKQAWHYLCLVSETLGQAWLTPDLFRFGASSLLNDLLRSLVKLETGTYAAAHDFSDA
ncbi:MAG: deoxyribose-phosphate aldolase [Phycisphaerales bacterium]